MYKTSHKHEKFWPTNGHTRTLLLFYSFLSHTYDDKEMELSELAPTTTTTTTNPLNGFNFFYFYGYLPRLSLVIWSFLFSQFLRLTVDSMIFKWSV